jgi:hypothetical protein
MNFIKRMLKMEEQKFFYTVSKTLVKAKDKKTAMELSNENEVYEMHEVDATRLFFHTCGEMNVSYRESSEKFEQENVVLLKNK